MLLKKWPYYGESRLPSLIIWYLELCPVLKVDCQLHCSVELGTKVGVEIELGKSNVMPILDPNHAARASGRLLSMWSNVLGSWHPKLQLPVILNPLLQSLFPSGSWSCRTFQQNRRNFTVSMHMILLSLSIWDRGTICCNVVLLYKDLSFPESQHLP